MDDVVLNKASIVERCLLRIAEEYAGESAHLFDDLTKQDSILLNLQRACEACIDLAMHLVRVGRLGVPQDSRDAFALLVRAGRLEPALGHRLMKMVGFRNIAIHDYRKLDLAIVESLLRSGLTDLTTFTALAIRDRGVVPPDRG